jgi:hypothetical protein
MCLGQDGDDGLRLGYGMAPAYRGRVSHFAALDYQPINQSLTASCLWPHANTKALVWFGGLLPLSITL